MDDLKFEIKSTGEAVFQLGKAKIRFSSALDKIEAAQEACGVAEYPRYFALLANGDTKAMKAALAHLTESPVDANSLKPQDFMRLKIMFTAWSTNIVQSVYEGDDDEEKKTEAGIG